MSQFDDARTLVEHSAAKIESLRTSYQDCLANKSVTPKFLVEVKNFMENLRSVLDYCARGLFSKYGQSKKENPKIYFPYAIPPKGKQQFRDDVDKYSIPGLLAKRPEIIDILENYQYFGNIGNWLYQFMKITNENKHEQLKPQVEKQFKMVHISGSIPSGETLEIDLTNIQLGGGPEAQYNAVAGIWTGLVFEGTNVTVMLHLENALQNISRIVDELSTA